MARFSKGKFFLFLFSGLVVVFVLLMTVLRPAWGGIEQPLPFNHKLHADNGLDCIDCHKHFQNRSFSGKPDLETCAGCHSETLGASAAEKALAEFINQDREIPWRRLYRVPADVVFSHRLHTAVGGIECRSCHGGIGESTSPPRRPVRITMSRCMKCHRERKVNNDCLSCHM